MESDPRVLYIVCVIPDESPIQTARVITSGESTDSPCNSCGFLILSDINQPFTKKEIFLSSNFLIASFQLLLQILFSLLDFKLFRLNITLNLK